MPRHCDCPKNKTVNGNLKVRKNAAVCGDLCVAGNLSVGGELSTSDLNIKKEQNVVIETRPDGLSSTIVSQGNANPFHGWWAEVVRYGGVQYGEGGSPLSYDVAAFIFIDTTKNPIEITAMGGNGKDNRYPLPQETDASGLFNQVDDTSLVSIFSNNPNDLNAYASLKLQPDGKIIACADTGTQTVLGNYGPTRGPDSSQSVLLKKVFFEDLDLPIPQYDELDYLPKDYTRPTQLAKYIYNTLTYHCLTKAPGWNNDYIGFYAANAKFKEYLTTGVTHKTLIDKIRTTKNNSGMTEINCLQYPNCPLGSNVTFSGFQNGWTGMNGTIVNGVSVHAFGSTPNPSPLHLDTGNSNGTFFHSFYVNKDTSTYPQYQNNAGYPRYADGVATAFHWGGPAYVSVTHRITDDMSYAEFIAAIFAMYYDIFVVSSHINFSTFINVLSRKFLPQTFSDVQNLLTNDQALIGTYRTRLNRNAAQFLYLNTARTPFPYSPSPSPLIIYPWNFNDAYGLLPTAASKFNYWVTAQNYLVGVRNLYYTLAGTPEPGTIQELAGLALGYKNISGTNTGGAYFIGTTAPMIYNNIASGNPNPAIWTLIDSQTGLDLAASLFHFGFVNPLYTQGKKVGYIRMGSQNLADRFGFIGTLTFTKKEDQDSPRFGFESQARVFSELMKYLKTGHPNGPGLDDIVVDLRCAIGGLIETDLVFGSMFGAKRHCSDGQVLHWRDNANRPLETYASFGYDSYNGVLSTLDQQEAYIYSDQTALRYGPDAVFNNGKVIVLSDNEATSAGSVIVPMVFLGQNNDKQLGDNTPVVLLGNVDGRLYGGVRGTGFSQSYPLQKYSERLKDSDGSPLSAIPIVREDLCISGYVVACNGRPVSIQNAQTAIDPSPNMKGGAGGNPLPEDLESTAYVDFGYMYPHPRPALPGWGNPQPDPNNNKTWRDSWFEQTVLTAML